MKPVGGGRSNQALHAASLNGHTQPHGILLACADFRFKGGGGSLEPPGWSPPKTGLPYREPPQKKNGSHNRTPQTNQGTSRVSMEGGGRGEAGAVLVGRMGDGGDWKRSGAFT